MDHSSHNLGRTGITPIWVASTLVSLFGLVIQHQYANPFLQMGCAGP
jgi:hypothetical protein